MVKQPKRCFGCWFLFMRRLYNIYLYIYMHYIWIYLNLNINWNYPHVETNSNNCVIILLRLVLISKCIVLKMIISCRCCNSPLQSQCWWLDLRWVKRWDTNGLFKHIKFSKQWLNPKQFSCCISNNLVLSFGGRLWNHGLILRNP